MALSPAFSNATRRCLLATAAAASLMAGNAFAQETPAEAPADATPVATETAPAAAPRNSSTTTTRLDGGSCMETTVTSNRNRGLLSLFGRDYNKSASVYDEQCGKDKIALAAAVNLMTATTADGTPDVSMQALGVQIYLEQSPENRALLDRALEERDTSFGQISFSVSNSDSSVRCVSQPAPALPGATAEQGVSNVSFRCIPRPALNPGR